MTRPPVLSVTILGVGAMGSLFGSYLAELSSLKVTLLGSWAEQIETVNRRGLTIIHPDGSRTIHRLFLTTSVTNLPPADLVLILVKSYHTRQAAQTAARILRSEGLVITLQNGLGNLSTLAEVVGADRAGLGITMQAATVTAPGQLFHAGHGSTCLAAIPGKTDRLNRIVTLFNAAGLPTTLVDNADSLVWGKLVVNAAINPLTALFEVPNGALLQNSGWQQMMLAAAEETARVAAAMGISLPFASASNRVIEVAQATAANRSSMLQDINRHAPTEIEAICGAVVNAGRKQHVPTPVLEFLQQQVKRKEAGVNFNSGFPVTPIDVEKFQ